MRSLAATALSITLFAGVGPAYAESPFSKVVDRVEKLEHEAGEKAQRLEREGRAEVEQNIHRKESKTADEAKEKAVQDIEKAVK
ncbi:hypothetical protein CAL14_16090 [Bordetella genomosp. 9]|uniref:hypothetical protein n=1 Tax=Bordetella genomosp. 9 TaxID=1416803 RepID=UPI000A291346|nr:hypothetical protein [Bordetella genomosp. 9]ARP91617.1 hypothetical protein CAL14_16090 [Bordetella genomosp. 9]